MKYILILLLITFSFLNADTVSDEKIVALDVKINQLKKQVKVIEDRGEFTNKDFDNIDVLDKKIQKLMDEKLAIVERDNAALSEEEKRLKEENIELEKQLQLADKKLEALNRIGKILDSKVESPK